jgi:GntR family transcriptional repressor for pyruvate dehydrogenase complex
MSIEYDTINKEGMSKQIADAIRAAIMEGRLVVEERLPSEHELAQRFGVSRPTVREALKRLAAQNLIRTRRGSTGGVFVNRLSWSEAHESLLTTATLLVGMNEIPFETVAEARYALESACLPLACERRQDAHLEAMRHEIDIQRGRTLSDEDFCASDVRFHRALVDAAGNPVLAFQMVGVVEAMQPLMNMITYRMRERNRIAELHGELLAAVEARSAERADTALRRLAGYTAELAQMMRDRRG